MSVKTTTCANGGGAPVAEGSLFCASCLIVQGAKRNPGGCSLEQLTEPAEAPKSGTMFGGLVDREAPLVAPFIPLYDSAKDGFTARRTYHELCREAQHAESNRHYGHGGAWVGMQWQEPRNPAEAAALAFVQREFPQAISMPVTMLVDVLAETVFAKNPKATAARDPKILDALLAKVENDHVDDQASLKTVLGRAPMQVHTCARCLIACATVTDGLCASCVQAAEQDADEGGEAATVKMPTCDATAPDGVGGPCNLGAGHDAAGFHMDTDGKVWR